MSDNPSVRWHWAIVKIFWAVKVLSVGCEKLHVSARSPV